MGPTSERAGASAAPKRAHRLLNLLGGALVMIALVASAVPVLSRTAEQARVEAFQRDLSPLVEALLAFEASEGRAPSADGRRGRAFNLSTLAPLSDGGYLAAPDAVLAKLHNTRLDVYDNPGERDGRGFWLVATCAEDPRIQILVARTDHFPLVPERWLEGLYLVRGGTLEKLAALTPLEPGGGA
jgi:hypothetical protein